MLIVHHLNFSRSTRVLWLLEELAVPYDIKRYERDANFRAPPALKQIHPLGKAPVLEDGALKLAESSTILTYINVRHGNGRMAPVAGSDDAFIHDEWLQFGESSAALSIMMKLIGGMMGGLPERLDGFATGEVAVTLNYLSSQVAERTYLMGDALTLADIQISYLLVMADSAGLLGNHPHVVKYLSRLQARPAYLKAVEVGGPLVPRRS